MGAISIRYTPTKNNKTKDIHYFTDFPLCVETLHEISSKKG